jgi:SAM-dependent methyltransferase
LFFDTVVRQASFRTFHRNVDDAMFDEIATACGCKPIGRMCLLDDTAVADLTKRCRVESGAAVLDIGCGRGFLGRWLRANGIEVRYAGVDRIAEAVATAREVPSAHVVECDFREYRGNQEFDAGFAIEIAIDGTLDEAILDVLKNALRPGGSFAATIASLDGDHAPRLATLAKAAERRFINVSIEDWTSRAIPFARCTYRRWLAVDWPSEIVEKTTLEALTALDAIEGGAFHYAVLIGTS